VKRQESSLSSSCRLDARWSGSEQSQLLTQHYELALDASDGLAGVFSQVGVGLDIWHKRSISHINSTLR
jgi:hypothetical protein